MYSRHAIQFDRLLDAGMLPEQVSVLRDIFSNANMGLEHSGTVTFRGSVVAPAIQSCRWAVAQHNWDYNEDSNTYPSNNGGMSLVLCREADDFKGNGTTGRSDIQIYLPVGPGEDPNVVAGDVIMFFEAKDGSKIAPGYGDHRIGSVRMGVQGDNGTEGWSIMDGTANSKDNGGTGLNVADKFMRCWASSSDSGNTGGAASAAVSVTVGDHNISDIAGGIGAHAGSDVAGTISDHPASGLSHKHEVTSTTIGTGSMTGVGVLTGDSVSGNFYTKLANAGASDLAHAGTGSLSHSGSGTISHTVSGGSVATVPPYMYVAMMERLNNSRTGLGL